MFFDFGGEPSASGTAPISGNFLAQAVGPTGVKYSNKHDGLALYFSRLISSIWKKKMFEIRYIYIYTYICKVNRHIRNTANIFKSILSCF